MVGRREVQQAHERAQVELFLRWFNQRYRSHFKVIAEPNPPEAIIESGRTKRWVEVSTAFLSDELAQDEYSYATLGEVHKPVRAGLHMNMDTHFAARFVEVVRKKLEKKSYMAAKEDYGPGYLIIPLRSPFFNAATLVEMRREWVKQSINNLGCFRSVFITYSSLNRTCVRRWPT